MSFTLQQIANACATFGNQVAPLPSGVEGEQLLWAISGCESSFGLNVNPRHEAAFDTGGVYANNPPMPALLEKYGSAAACSYGPWQILLVNAPEGTSPQDFSDLDLAAQATVGFLNSLLRRFKPQTLAEIASCWNAGHIQNPLSAGVQRYAEQLEKYYVQPIPET